MEEADEKHRRNPDELPSGEEHVDAAGQHHEVHAEPKENEEHEEPGEAGLTMEVFPGKGVDQQAETGREADVRHGESVGHEIDRGRMVPHGKPGAEVNDLGHESPPGEHGKHDHRGDEGDGKACPHQPGRGLLTKGTTEDQRDPDGDERQGRRSQLGHDEEGHQIVDQGGIHRGAPVSAAIVRAGGRWPRWPPNQSTERSTTAIRDDSG